MCRICGSGKVVGVAVGREVDLRRLAAHRALAHHLALHLAVVLDHPPQAQAKAAPPVHRLAEEAPHLPTQADLPNKAQVFNLVMEAAGTMVEAPLNPTEPAKLHLLE